MVVGGQLPAQPPFTGRSQDGDPLKVPQPEPRPSRDAGLSEPGESTAVVCLGICDTESQEWARLWTRDWETRVLFQSALLGRSLYPSGPHFPYL